GITMNNLHELLQKLPEGISDETAAVIIRLLNDLTKAWEWRYFDQIRRFEQVHLPDPFESEQPSRR
ncbi:MAG: hypothetical protein BECKG1743F_GA0114225_112022, partial [Candidatus Kentron sp. G]